MKAEIISIGSEILLGKITDTNVSYLAGQLPLLGIDLQWTTQVGDNQARIVETLRQAWRRSDFIITTGGLGPTADDLTRESIAEALGEEMKVAPRAIPNPGGTAPGWWIERKGRIILDIPGPPQEMQRMWEKEIKGELRKMLGTATIASRTLKIFGLSEATVDEIISPFLSSANPSIGTYSKPSGIEVRLTARASDEKKAEQIISPVEANIRSIIGDYVWGVNDELLERTVGELLHEKGMTLATMESCTGGLLANLITDVSGSSRYFKGGMITYSNEIKLAFGVDRQLIVQYGAVSSQVAEAMARVARDRLGADVGVGITEVAGPNKQEGKPVGTVYVGTSNASATRSVYSVFPGPRWRIKSYAAIKALVELRQLLRDKC